MSPRRIKDQFSMVGSRQTRYRLRMLKLGHCRNHGKKLSKDSKVFCPECLVKHKKQVATWRKEFKKFTTPVSKSQ